MQGRIMNTGQVEQLTNARAILQEKVLLRWRYFFPALIAALILASETRSLVLGVISDAFFQVGVFVLATLSLYHLVATYLGKKTSIPVAKYPITQVGFAAFLGAIPGCGGAIIVITQFIQGKFSFGSVVAVLTATMGDAAFLLIASKPFDGLTLIIISVSVGTVTGYVIDSIFGKDYLRVEPQSQPQHNYACNKGTIEAATYVWKITLIPAMVISLLYAFQIDPNTFLSLPEGTVELLGALFAIIAIITWAKAKTSVNNKYQEFVAEEHKTCDSNWFSRAVQDTNFVLTWAVAAFVLFELINHFSAFNLTAWFHQYSGFAPFVGVLVGLLPGCGPQIIVTSLYIQGAIPFSAQLGNAISNDGDALFPAIALAPKIAIYATLYSTIPAMLVAYGYFFIFEN